MGSLLIANGPMPTTSSFAKVASGTGIKTMLQLKPFNVCEIVEWGISFSGFVAALPVQVELIDTGTVFGTVTASVDADCFKIDSVEQAVASVAGLTMGTSATGYTCTSEGSITATRVFDPQQLPPTGPYVKQFPLGERPRCVIGNAVRIRVLAGTTVDIYCYMVVRF